MVMEQKNKISVFETPVELRVATAALIVILAQEAIKARGRFVIALSGGHTPEQLFTLLSKPSFSTQMDWNKTFVFWGDERCVPLNDPENNAYRAKTLLFDQVAIPSSNVYAIPVDLPPAEAAMAYENKIRSFFGTAAPVFDLILLGLGENGHTASLFPGTEVLQEKDRLVKEVYVEEQKMYRVTMTVSLINKARTIVFLVAGLSKATIVETILSASYLPYDKYPARLIKPEQGILYWYLDDAAATLL